MSKKRTTITVRRETMGVRETTITLRVSWDPATQDHPAGWDWEELLGCDAVVVDFSDKEDG